MRYMLLVLVLGGCAEFPTSGLQGPADRCMRAPGDLPGVKEGTDLVQAYAQLSSQYITVASRLKCDQRYIRAVTK
jgi:hypothetical protein